MKVKLGMTTKGLLFHTKFLLQQCNKKMNKYQLLQMMHCLMHTLYAKVDVQCDKLDKIVSQLKRQQSQQ